MAYVDGVEMKDVEIFGIHSTVANIRNLELAWGELEKIAGYPLQCIEREGWEVSDWIAFSRELNADVISLVDDIITMAPIKGGYNSLEGFMREGLYHWQLEYSKEYIEKIWTTMVIQNDDCFIIPDLGVTVRYPLTVNMGG